MKRRNTAGRFYAPPAGVLLAVSVGGCDMSGGSATGPAAASSASATVGGTPGTASHVAAEPAARAGR